MPGLFDGRYGLVTEFGRSLPAKHGTVVARAEYAKSAGSRPVAVTHAGVQVATRTVYAPESWPLRIAAYDAQGRPKEGPAVVQDVAGPACFAGDLLARAQPLPLLEQGDYAAAPDTGAYYYAYNSLPRPGIHGFVPDGAGGVTFATARPQTIEEIVTESGAAHTDALVPWGHGDRAGSRPRRAGAAAHRAPEGTGLRRGPASAGAHRPAPRRPPRYRSSGTP